MPYKELGAELKQMSPGAYDDVDDEQLAWLFWTNIPFTVT